MPFGGYRGAVVFHPHSVSSFSVLLTCMLKAQNTKLVHANTTASSSSAMLEKHGSTKSNVSSRPSGIWAYAGV